MPQQSLKPLKILVFSMGLVLMGGMILLVGLIWSRAGKPAPVGTVKCAPATLNLRDHGKAESVKAEGGRWLISFRTPEGFRLLTLDGCDGRVISDISISTQ